VAVADAITDELVAIRKIDPARVTPETLLIELGLDSIQGVEFLVALESRFNLKLRDDAITIRMSVRDVVQMIEEQLK